MDTPVQPHHHQQSLCLYQLAQHLVAVVVVVEQVLPLLLLQQAEHQLPLLTDLSLLLEYHLDCQQYLLEDQAKFLW